MVLFTIMHIFDAIILGFVQGITEFLPISSTGHLIIVREIFGLSLENSLSFDIFLHLATLLAIVVYLWKDILKLFTTENRKKIFYIFIATLPAVFLGLILKDYIEEVFRNIYFVLGALVVGSIVFFAAEYVYKKISTTEITLKNSFIMGCFQALALIPGLSRSGMTISGGLFLGLKREEAVRFSFILGIPIILGAGIMDILGADAGLLSFMSAPVILGALSAFVSGLFAIHFLVKFLSKHTLSVFAWYRIALVVLILFFTLAF